jgi:adenine C2-methylase RlmN of 23S rRNA A2503 and tRNA A37
MEVYRTKDGLVSKYVHDDGSETAIKSVSSCGNILNKATGKIEPVEVDRNKFSVFISSSVGCNLGCKFCYLTTKKYPYHKLSMAEIFNNVKEALTAEVTEKPQLRKKYMKLSWMGMGDAFLLDPIALREVSNKILIWAVRDKGVAVGVDGIDIATMLPVSIPGWPHHLAALNDDCFGYRINPHSKDRSNLRIFYSLHKFSDRKDLMPSSRYNDVANDLQLLNQFKQWYGVDIILHQLFLEGVNDTEHELRQIKSAIDCLIPDTELRILRFNECKDSVYKESSRFDALVKMYSDALPKIKYQISAGSEIQAACGMFLMGEKPNTYQFKEF